jgi:hypothetical protein
MGASSDGAKKSELWATPNCRQSSDIDWLPQRDGDPEQQAQFAASKGRMDSPGSRSCAVEDANDNGLDAFPDASIRAMRSSGSSGADVLRARKALVSFRNRAETTI